MNLVCNKICRAKPRSHCFMIMWMPLLENPRNDISQTVLSILLFLEERVMSRRLASRTRQVGNITSVDLFPRDYQVSEQQLSLEPRVGGLPELVSFLN